MSVIAKKSILPYLTLLTDKTPIQAKANDTKIAFNEDDGIAISRTPTKYMFRVAKTNMFKDSGVKIYGTNG